MNSICKRSLSLILALTLTATACMATGQTPRSEIDALLEKSAEYIYNTVNSPQVDSVGGEWAVIGLARSGYTVPQAYYDTYYANVEKYVKACNGVLHEKKYTEYSRVIIALTAIGADPESVGGYNLFTALGDYDKTVWQGINGPIWALIALDSGGYDMPLNAAAKTQATRQMYIDEILLREHANGGWSLGDRGGSKDAADADITGMALQALAKYQDQEEVKAATDRAVAWLSDSQKETGGFSFGDAENMESVTQVIVGLCELGIDVEDSRFVKNGKSLVDNLLGYRQTDGSFLHTIGGYGNNQMSGEQGLYALAAISRSLGGKNSLYRMEDVTVAASEDIDTPIGLPGKHGDVKSVLVTSPGMTFDDIEAHANQLAIESLSSRSIINGMGDGTFAPDATMTRAQFAAIVVRGLGLELEQKSSGEFADVPASHWAAAYVDTACAYGIVNGVGGGLYNPDGAITRQEAAVMVTRAAGLCGMDTELDDTEIRDMLAPFSDYITAADWAKSALAFCYLEGIVEDSGINILPSQPILRCEIAQMLYNMLVCAKLV